MRGTYTKLILIIGECLAICYGFGSHTNFFIKRFDHCDPKANYTVDMNFKIKTVDNVQYADGAFIFAVDVGSNIRSNFSIELLTFHSYRHLFSMKEKDLCVALHKYLGEFIYEIERHARILPGLCPIPKICYGYGSNTNFFIKRLERCDPNVIYSVDMFFKITTVDNVQYADGAFNFSVDVGSNIRSNFTIEMLTLHRYRHLFSMREKNLCAAFHKYLGEFMYDVERNAQILPGVCPIAKGVYRLHNYRLDFRKIALQTFPFGRLRFTEIAYDQQNNICLCLIIELDNREIE